MLYHLLYPMASEIGGLNVVRYVTFRTTAAALTALFLAFLLGPSLIRALARLRAGQPIRQIGPEHHAKAGTPTMGGLLILCSLLVSVLLWSNLSNRLVWIVIGVTVGYGLLGFLDDYQKVTRRRNEAGLTARAKIVGQLVIAFGVALAIYFDPSFDAELSLPFVKDFTPHLGFLYVPLAAIVIVGASNAVNLTDGLDGLAIGPVMITAGTFLLLSYAAGHARIADYLAIKYVAGADQLPIFCGALIGGGLAFLWFNAYPANLFMGDVGSLALGGALGTIAVLIRQEILLGVVGGVFVAETLSVVIQVAWFRLTGRRVFLMAPIHHHFEKMGWHEQTIVIRFWIISAILGLVALSSLKLRWMRTLETQRALVLGLGRSGRSAAQYLAAQGARVVAADERAPGALDGLEELDASIELRVGEAFPDPAGFDLVVPSPGVPAARWAGARRALGDVELAWRALSVPVVAITGTNGKTTTTELTARMLVAAGLRAEAAGNIGRPALELLGLPLDVAVLEVSSFQLEAVDAFRPRVAIVLNVTPDHLDRHGSLAVYAETKARIVARQADDDVAIGSADDRRAHAIVTRSGGRCWLFSTHAPVERGAWWDAGAAVLREAGATQRVVLDGLEDADSPPPREDVLAALLACRALGADVAKASTALRAYAAPPHRRQLVARHAGIAWVDDSKATNPDAARLALETLSGPAIWIAGGRNKGLDFASLADLAVTRARAAVLIGEAAGPLEAAIGGRIPVRRAASIEDAVEIAGEAARAGDAVLLSPACASFDQFRSYEERGARFATAARAWITARGGTA